MFFAKALHQKQKPIGPASEEGIRLLFGDQPLNLKKLFGLIRDSQDNPQATKSTRRVFRRYLKDCGLLDVVGPREKFGIYLAKHLGQHGDYELSRVKDVHQGAWRWTVKYVETNSPTPEQIKQAKCYVLVPRGTSRFSREPSASHYEQKVRGLGYTADVIFHRQGGYAVRLYDVDHTEADSIARQVLRDVVEIKNPLKREGKKTIIESSPVIPAIGYWPEQKFLDRALIDDRTRTGSIRRRPHAYINFGWDIF